MNYNLATVAKNLEDNGKITREACIAILQGDEDTYSEEMLNAAQKVMSGQSPYFLSKAEIRELRDQYQNRQVVPVESNNDGEKLIDTGAKWLFLHMTGLALPYLAYKAVDAISNNKKTVGGIAAGLAIAAFVGLDSDDIS